MNILLLDSYFIDSHKKWAENLQKHSRHKIEIISQSSVHWKWRMHASALEFADLINQREKLPDLILATDMIDISVLKSNLNRTIPIVLYFHENQIVYPYSKKDTDKLKNRENHYGFINFTSALSADKVVFNSTFHNDVFVNTLPTFLDQFPKNSLKNKIQEIKSKTSIIPIGLELNKFLKIRKENSFEPISILWNHRWEYDKNPAGFYNLLKNLEQKGINFRINCIGQKFRNSPKEFDLIQQQFSEKLNYFGWVEKEEYLNVLEASNVIPVFSNHEFFGISVVEAISAGVIPILPNKLVYPEHVPLNLQKLFLYIKEDEIPGIINRMKSLTQDTIEQLRNFQKKYLISNVIKLYDQLFETI